MNHRLYIIEGLPCSGKSTASAFVAELLKQQGNLLCQNPYIMMQEW
jgi:thymidylate kinase